MATKKPKAKAAPKSKTKAAEDCADDSSDALGAPPAQPVVVAAAPRLPTYLSADEKAFAAMSHYANLAPKVDPAAASASHDSMSTDVNGVDDKLAATLETFQKAADYTAMPTRPKMVNGVIS